MTDEVLLSSAWFFVLVRTVSSGRSDPSLEFKVVFGKEDWRYGGAVRALRAVGMYLRLDSEEKGHHGRQRSFPRWVRDSWVLKRTQRSSFWQPHAISFEASPSEIPDSSHSIFSSMTHRLQNLSLTTANQIGSRDHVLSTSSLIVDQYDDKLAYTSVLC